MNYLEEVCLRNVYIWKRASASQENQLSWSSRWKLSQLSQWQHLDSLCAECDVLTPAADEGLPTTTTDDVTIQFRSTSNSVSSIFGFNRPSKWNGSSPGTLTEVRTQFIQTLLSESESQRAEFRYFCLLCVVLFSKARKVCMFAIMSVLWK